MGSGLIPLPARHNLSQPRRSAVTSSPFHCCPCCPWQYSLEQRFGIGLPSRLMRRSAAAFAALLLGAAASWGMAQRGDQPPRRPRRTSARAGQHSQSALRRCRSRALVREPALGCSARHDHRCCGCRTGRRPDATLLPRHGDCDASSSRRSDQGVHRTANERVERSIPGHRRRRFLGRERERCTTAARAPGTPPARPTPVTKAEAAASRSTRTAG